MIELKLEDYCQKGCTEFEPDCREEVYYAFSADDRVIITVGCTHADRCRNMVDYLKSCIKED